MKIIVSLFLTTFLISCRPHVNPKQLSENQEKNIDNKAVIETTATEPIITKPIEQTREEFLIQNESRNRYYDSIRNNGITFTYKTAHGRNNTIMTKVLYTNRSQLTIISVESFFMNQIVAYDCNIQPNSSGYFFIEYVKSIDDYSESGKILSIVDNNNEEHGLFSGKFFNEPK